MFYRLSILMLLLVMSSQASAQNSVAMYRQNPNKRIITTAVPFLTFAPDSRHSAMGDAGVATSPDANSAHYNSGKLAFIEDDFGASLSYSPWLGNMMPDMSLVYLTGYKKINDVSAIGIDLRYFDMGAVRLTDGNGNVLGHFNPRDMAFGVTYSRKLSSNLSLGISTRYIHSNLTGFVNDSRGNEGRPGRSVGSDVGIYYTRPISRRDDGAILSLGANVSNIGPKITYNSAEDLDYLPTMFRLGTALSYPIADLHEITFTVDINKLMVPTPPVYEENADGTLVRGTDGWPMIESGRDPRRPMFSGMLGSFADAPGGFTEEIQEIMVSTGIEYAYDNKLALRVGYFYEHENKGGRRYFTTGLGFGYRGIGFDFSYLVPVVQNHPLAETLRFTLSYNVSK